MPFEKPRHRIAVLADQCVQCGLCLPVCPTYALDGSETESPRGRIAIAAALALGQASPSPQLREPLDHCLGCLNCQRACPAGIQYEALLVETRALLGPAPGRPRLLLEIAKRPNLNRWLQRLARRTAAARWFPRLLDPGKRALWRASLALLPTSPTIPATSSVQQHHGTQTDTVALFPGCVASVQDADAAQAAELLLAAVGYRVIRMPAFCCGALDLHDGEAAEAEAAAERTRRAWTAMGADHLVTVTSGCLGTLRRALPGVRVDDPVVLLAARIGRLRFRPLARRVALHVPCTQANVARSDAALAALLQQIPELALRRLPTPPYCCGAAGSHVLQFPERAGALRDGVISHLDALDAELLLSSNIGCRLHLAAGLAQRTTTLPTMHPLTLLAQQWDP
ncbi:glycolate oxidase subunit GlcF [Dyella jejuensis]